MGKLTASIALGAGMLVALPAMAGTVTMYTPWEEWAIDLLQEEIDSRDLDIQIEFYRSAGVELDMLFSQEQQAELARVDYVMMDPDYLEIYKERGYLHQSPIENADEFDPGAIDPDGYWFAVEYSPMFMVYNTNLLQGDDVPTSWRDMTDSRFENLIGMADPRTSTAIQFPLTYWTDTLAQSIGEPEYGWSFVEDLAQNNPRLATGHSQLTDMVITGEIAVAPLMMGPVLNPMEAGEPLGIALPEEGAPMQIVGGAVVENAPNRDDAIRLHEFLASEDGQRAIFERAQKLVGHNNVEQILPDGTTLDGFERARLVISDEQRSENLDRIVQILGL